MLTPNYVNRMASIGCGSSDSSSDKLLLELQEQLKEQALLIATLQKALAKKVDNSNLIIVRSLGDEPLFMAIPL